MEFFKLHEAGVTSDVVTVGDVCRAYVMDLRTAEKRFERNIYENELGGRALAKLRTPHLKAWRDALGLKPSTSNRTQTALKAALNLALAYRQVQPSAAIEWAQVKPAQGWQTP